MSLDRYFTRRYDDDNYNCLHFARDVIFDATGADIKERLEKCLQPVSPSKRISKSGIAAFKRIAVPEDYCLVVMRRPRISPHVGVWIRGRVLHIQARGVEYQPIEVAAHGFTEVTYLKW